MPFSLHVSQWRCNENSTEKNHTQAELKDGSVSDHSGGRILVGPFSLLASHGSILFMLSPRKAIFKQCFLWHGRTFSQHSSYIISSRTHPQPDGFKETRHTGLGLQREPSSHFLWKDTWVRQGDRRTWTSMHWVNPSDRAGETVDCNTDSKASSSRFTSNYKPIFYMENDENTNAPLSVLKMLILMFSSTSSMNKSWNEVAQSSERTRFSLFLCGIPDRLPWMLKGTKRVCINTTATKFLYNKFCLGIFKLGIKR